MKFLSIAPIIGCALALEACATTDVHLTSNPQGTPYWQTQYVSYDTFAKKFSGEVVVIRMTDGREVRGRLVGLDADSVRWSSLEDEGLHGVSASRVDYLTCSRDYLWEGAIAGLVAGASPPLLLGGWEVTYDGNAHTPQYTGRYIVGLCGFTGCVGGAIAGALVHHTYQAHYR